MDETIDIDGLFIIFLVGANAKHNSELVANADELDVWFHVAVMPSAHVIAKIHNLHLTPAQYKRVIARGASLLKSRSKYRLHKSLKITFAKIKNVHTTATPGLVTLGRIITFVYNPTYIVYTYTLVIYRMTPKNEMVKHKVGFNVDC